MTTIPLPLAWNEPRGRGKIWRIRGPDKPDLETRREGERKTERGDKARYKIERSGREKEREKEKLR